MHTVTTDDAMRRDKGVLAPASGKRDDPWARRMADGRRGRQQLGELSPAVASLAVSVITVTVLLSVIAHGASAEPLARRYGAAAGPGGNGDHGLPWAGLSTHLSFPEIAAEMFLSRTTIKSEALSAYSRLGALLTRPGSRPVR